MDQRLSPRSRDLEFMEQVVPWPSAGEDGYVNLHWKIRSPQTGADVWSGRPLTNASDFMNLVQLELHRQNQFKDLYFCLSRQAKTGPHKRGKPTVARSAANALALRAIWLDVDVKDSPKGYATLQEAIKSIYLFADATHIPRPNALVASGGGVHAYWISDCPLSVDEWRPYAEGLKTAAIQYGLRADYGVTTDCARILRIPGTYNHKTEPAKQVKLLLLEPAYKFPEKLTALMSLAPTKIGTAAVPEDLPFDAAAFAGKKPAPGFASLPMDESLSEGIKQELAPLDPHPIITGCGFYNDALLTHGKDHQQPLWNLAVLGTVFMERGRDLAHMIGNGHPDYSPESTDAMYDRKEREHDEKGLGWPSCKAIADAGCALCATCPHFGKIKSPLNLAIFVPDDNPQAQVSKTVSKCADSDGSRP
jgi:hypothetical protein